MAGPNVVCHGGEVKKRAIFDTALSSLPLHFARQATSFPGSY